MYNETMYERGNAPSAIRELFAYGMERKAQIGEDKVFDFSIGNPSVPAPDSVAETIRELADMAPAQLHAYSAAQGLESTRAAIAENLNKRFGTHYTADNLYLTMGAAACLSACFTALIEPGDEIIVIAPYFPEYRIWYRFRHSNRTSAAGILMGESTRSGCRPQSARNTSLFFSETPV